jgi:hypothetical protein
MYGSQKAGKNCLGSSVIKQNEDIETILLSLIVDFTPLANGFTC